MVRSETPNRTPTDIDPVLPQKKCLFLTCRKKKCLFVETSRRPQRGTAARVRAATDLETRARVRSTHCFDRTRSLIACALLTPGFTGELTDDATTDPLKWWKKWGSKFPNLAQLARRYLAMPATSAPVERLFSVAGLVATAKRSRLAPSTVSLLVFLHEALPISRGLEVDSMLKSLDHDSDDSDEVMMMDES